MSALEIHYHCSHARHITCGLNENIARKAFNTNQSDDSAQ